MMPFFPPLKFDSTFIFPGDIFGKEGRTYYILCPRGSLALAFKGFKEIDEIEKIEEIQVI